MDNVDPDTIFVGVLGFMWAEFLWEAYIGEQQSIDLLYQTLASKVPFMIAKHLT